MTRLWRTMATSSLSRTMSNDITDATFERVGHLVDEYARLCGRTNLEVTHALLASRTLQKHGYTHAQRGHLTEDQGQAAIVVLNYWIGAKTNG